jgi:hypothetical protein
MWQNIKIAFKGSMNLIGNVNQPRIIVFFVPIILHMAWAGMWEFLGGLSQ